MPGSEQFLSDRINSMKLMNVRSKEEQRGGGGKGRKTFRIQFCEWPATQRVVCALDSWSATRRIHWVHRGPHILHSLHTLATCVLQCCLRVPSATCEPPEWPLFGCTDAPPSAQNNKGEFIKGKSTDSTNIICANRRQSYDQLIQRNTIALHIIHCGNVNRWT